ncbi:MAG: 7-cyano-7-deazaguanine synthase [Gemmataceae bacterium]
MTDASELPDRSQPLAVLASGGLDSAILLAEACREHPAVFPLYVRFGLVWEEVELAHLRRFLDAVAGPRLRALTVLSLPVRDLYGEHWSLTGRDVPAADTPDEAVFLPGRNVLLLAKGLLWCHLNGVPAVALAPLGSNPFPDATPEFFRAYQDVVNRAVGGAVRVVRPYAALHKLDVLRRGAGLPLGWTFSCIRPVDGLHCGACNKCGERQAGFRAAGMADPTVYHQRRL